MGNRVDIQYSPSRGQGGGVSVGNRVDIHNPEARVVGYQWGIVWIYTIQRPGWWGISGESYGYTPSRGQGGGVSVGY